MTQLEIDILTKYLGADQAKAAAADMDKLRQSTFAASNTTSHPSLER